MTWSQFDSQAAGRRVHRRRAEQSPNAHRRDGRVDEQLVRRGRPVDIEDGQSVVRGRGRHRDLHDLGGEHARQRDHGELDHRHAAGRLRLPEHDRRRAIGAPTTSPTVGADRRDAVDVRAASTVPASTTRTLIFTATASSTAGTYTNSVSAATSYGTLSSGATEIGVGSPALTIAKSASVVVGESRRRRSPTRSRTRTTPPVNVTNAVITDVLPAGLDFVSATGGGVYAAGTRTVTWNVGRIASGTGPFSVTLDATVTNPYPGGAAIPLVNTASIASTETSPRPRAAVAVRQRAARAQLANPEERQRRRRSPPGGNVTYTLTYANTGAAAATGVTLTDVDADGMDVRVGDRRRHERERHRHVEHRHASPPARPAASRLTLQASKPYTGANPSTNTATMSATGLTASSDRCLHGRDHQTGSVCSTYYFRNTTTRRRVRRHAADRQHTAVTAGDTGTSAVGDVDRQRQHGRSGALLSGSRRRQPGEFQPAAH